MGECCSDLYECIDDCINPTGSVGLTPQSRVKCVNTLRKLLDDNEVNDWPAGLSEGILFEGLRTGNIEDDDPRFPAGFRQKLRTLLTDITRRFFEGVDNKEQTIHTILVMFISSRPRTFGITADQYLIITQSILGLLQNEYLSAADPNNIGKFNKKDKHFVKFILSWCFHDPFTTGAVRQNWRILRKMATNCMEVLQIPLNTEYSRIAECKDTYHQQLVELKYDPPESARKMKNQNQLYPEWAAFVQSQNNNEYGHLRDEYLQPSIDHFRQNKLPNPEIVPFLFNLNGNVFAHSVYIEFWRQVAEILDGPFQEEMRQLFEANREEYKREVGDKFKEDKDAAFKGAPIKTAGRAEVKRYHYVGRCDDPVCGMITDWVRCAFVVYDTQELMMLYEVLLKKYGENITRVKNGFKKGTEGNYGYRAVLMNLVYEHDGLRMVVEIQLILLEYLKVRKSMHLFYKIARANNCRDFVLDVSKIQDIDKTKTNDWINVD
eukprot:1114677_1